MIAAGFILCGIGFILLAVDGWAAARRHNKLAATQERQSERLDRLSFNERMR